MYVLKKGKRKAGVSEFSDRKSAFSTQLHSAVQISEHLSIKLSVCSFVDFSLNDGCRSPAPSLTVIVVFCLYF